jgi:hypothetical protein
LSPTACFQGLVLAFLFGISVFPLHRVFALEGPIIVAERSTQRSQPRTGDLKGLLAWVRSTGLPRTVDGRVAKFLGLTKGADYPCIQRSWETSDKSFAIGLNVFNARGRTSILVFHKSRGLESIWLYSVSGELQSTIVASKDNKLTAVPNEQHRENREQILRFLKEKAAQ